MSEEKGVHPRTETVAFTEEEEANVAAEPYSEATDEQQLFHQLPSNLMEKARAVDSSRANGTANGGVGILSGDLPPHDREGALASTHTDPARTVAAGSYDEHNNEDVSAPQPHADAEVVVSSRLDEAFLRNQTVTDDGGLERSMLEASEDGAGSCDDSFTRPGFFSSTRKIVTADRASGPCAGPGEDALSLADDDTSVREPDTDPSRYDESRLKEYGYLFDDDDADTEAGSTDQFGQGGLLPFCVPSPQQLQHLKQQTGSSISFNGPGSSLAMGQSSSRVEARVSALDELGITQSSQEPLTATMTSANTTTHTLRDLPSPYSSAPITGLEEFLQLKANQTSAEPRCSASAAASPNTAVAAFAAGLSGGWATAMPPTDATSQSVQFSLSNPSMHALASPAAESVERSGSEEGDCGSSQLSIAQRPLPPQNSSPPQPPQGNCGAYTDSSTSFVANSNGASHAAVPAPKPSLRYGQNQPERLGSTTPSNSAFPNRLLPLNGAPVPPLSGFRPLNTFDVTSPEGRYRPTHASGGITIAVGNRGGAPSFAASSQPSSPALGLGQPVPLTSGVTIGNSVRMTGQAAGASPRNPNDSAHYWLAEADGAGDHGSLQANNVSSNDHPMFAGRAATTGGNSPSTSLQSSTVVYTPRASSMAPIMPVVTGNTSAYSASLQNASVSGLFGSRVATSVTVGAGGNVTTTGVFYGTANNGSSTRNTNTNVNEGIAVPSVAYPLGMLQASGVFVNPQGVPCGASSPPPPTPPSLSHALQALQQQQSSPAQCISPRSVYSSFRGSGSTMISQQQQQAVLSLQTSPAVTPTTTHTAPQPYIPSMLSFSQLGIANVAAGHESPHHSQHAAGAAMAEAQTHASDTVSFPPHQLPATGVALLPRPLRSSLLPTLSSSLKASLALISTPSPLLLVGLAGDANIQRKRTNVHGALAGVVDYFSYCPSGTAASTDPPPAHPSTIILPAFFNSNHVGMDVTNPSVFPLTVKPNDTNSCVGSADAASIPGGGGGGGGGADGEGRERLCRSTNANTTTHSPREFLNVDGGSSMAVTSAGDLSDCTLHPIFFQMFPCELRDQAAQVLNRVMDVAAALHALEDTPAVPPCAMPQQPSAPEDEGYSGANPNAASISAVSLGGSLSRAEFSPCQASANSPTQAGGQQQQQQQQQRHLVLGRVLQIEPRTETSFIALVATNNVKRLIYILRRRILLDRFGFFYCKSFHNYLKMKEYCETVRPLPQQSRHFQTDGLPCMPLVVEIARSHPSSAPTLSFLPTTYASGLSGSLPPSMGPVQTPSNGLTGCSHSVSGITPSVGNYLGNSLSASGGQASMMVMTTAPFATAPPPPPPPGALPQVYLQQPPPQLVSFQLQPIRTQPLQPSVAVGQRPPPRDDDRDVPKCFDEIVPMAAVDRRHPRAGASPGSNSNSLRARN